MTDRRWRLLRGGSWFGGPHFCRAAFRDHDLPGRHDDLVGFRVCGPDPAEHVIPLEDHHG